MGEALPQYDGDYNRPTTPKTLCDCTSLRGSSEERGDRLKDKYRHYELDKGQRSKSSQSKISKKTQGTQSLKLQVERFIGTKELKSQVLDLQRQLAEAQSENKLLKRVQNRYKVALKHFQDSEGSISETINKHKNEVRGLRALLRDTRRCRNHLSRQLQATEYELLNTKSRLDHLQQLSQDQSLLEKEELIRMLGEANAELEEKDKRVIYLEKNLQLCQDSFNRQLATVQKKLYKARNFSCDLQQQIYQLTKENEDKAKKLQVHNIYSNRFLKGSTKIDKENKVVQTQGLVLLPTAYSHNEDSVREDDLKKKEKLDEQMSAGSGNDHPPHRRCLQLKYQEKDDMAKVMSEDLSRKASCTKTNNSKYKFFPKKNYFRNESWTLEDVDKQTMASAYAVEDSSSSESETFEDLGSSDLEEIHSQLSSDSDDEDEVNLEAQMLHPTKFIQSEFLDMPVISVSRLMEDPLILESRVTEAAAKAQSASSKDEVPSEPKVTKAPLTLELATSRETVTPESRIQRASRMSETTALEESSLSKSIIIDATVTIPSAELKGAQVSESKVPKATVVSASAALVKSQTSQPKAAGNKGMLETKATKSRSVSRESQKAETLGSGKAKTTESKKKVNKVPQIKKKQSLQSSHQSSRGDCSRLCRRTTS